MSGTQYKAMEASPGTTTSTLISDKAFQTMNTTALVLALTLLAATAVRAEDLLFDGETLATNEYLEHPPYKFIMQGDCNLVLYTGSKALWASGTNGQGTSCQATLQSNGDLVVLSGTSVIWSSNTARGSNNYRLIVQGDGNVVIYGAALWATNTVQSSSITSRKQLHN